MIQGMETDPIIVDETHFNITAPAMEEFSANHAPAAATPPSTSIETNQIVKEEWQTRQRSQPDALNPLAAPEFPATNPALSSDNDESSGFDVSQLSKYDHELERNRIAISEASMSNKNIKQRLNDTMKILTPLRKSLGELESRETELKKKLQLLKLKTKHKAILQAKKKLQEDEKERVLEEKRMEDLKQEHEIHLKNIKKHLATLNGELVETAKAEEKQESRVHGASEEEDNENEDKDEDEDEDKERAEELDDIAKESKKDERAVAEEMQEEKEDNDTEEAATGKGEDENENADEDKVVDSGTGSATGSGGIRSEEEKEKTDIEAEVDMDEKNQKAEDEESEEDDKLLDSISLKSEKAKETIMEEQDEE